MGFVTKNYHILIFMALLVAVIILFIDRKTPLAIMLMLGYIIGQVSNLKQLITTVETDGRVFQQPSTVGGTPTSNSQRSNAGGQNNPAL